MHSLFIPSSFSTSRRHLAALLWCMPLHFHPSLYTDFSVSPVGLVLFLGYGSLSSSTLLPPSRLSSFMKRSLTGIRYDCTLPLSFFSSLSSNTCVSLPYLMNLTHLWTHCNSWSPKSSCLIKIQSCSLLATVMTSLRVIMIPPSTSCLSLLGYLS